VVVVTAAGYLIVRVDHGLNFHTDLMALLPREDQNPSLQHANDVVGQALSRRIIIMVGHTDKAAAYAAAKEITKQLSDSGLFEITTNAFDKDQLRQIGQFYYPHRSGLLSDEDRTLLKNNQGQVIVTKAILSCLCQVFLLLYHYLCRTYLLTMAFCL
jgi:predicted exporter